MCSASGHAARCSNSRRKCDEALGCNIDASVRSGGSRVGECGEMKTQNHGSERQRAEAMQEQGAHIKLPSRFVPGASPCLAAMSRQPSPGPPPLRNNQMYHQPALPSSSSKQRTKPFTANLPGGADDVKYQAKYKELKKKVKEIELVRPSATRHAPLSGCTML